MQSRTFGGDGEMLKKLKSLFCNHLLYAYLSDKSHYTSVGDESYDRKSRHYYLICVKCNKRIDVVDVWTNENVLQVLREREDSHDRTDQ